MTEPRFYVVSVTGYGVTMASSANRNGRAATSYSVLDSAQAHREVFTRYAVSNQRGGNGGHDRPRREACEREAARRNAADAAGCPA